MAIKKRPPKLSKKDVDRILASAPTGALEGKVSPAMAKQLAKYRRRVRPPELPIEAKLLFSAMAHLTNAGACVSAAECDLDDDDPLVKQIIQLRYKTQQAANKLYERGQKLYGDDWP